MGGGKLRSHENLKSLLIYLFSILVGWTCWVLILPIIIEIIEALYGEKELGN